MSEQNRDELRRAALQKKIDALETAKKVVQLESKKRKEEMETVDQKIRVKRTREFKIENSTWVYHDPQNFQCIAIKWAGKIRLAVVRAVCKIPDRRGGGIQEYYLCDLYQKKVGSNSTFTSFTLDFQDFPASLKEFVDYVAKPKAVNTKEGVIVELKYSNDPLASFECLA